MINSSIVNNKKVIVGMSGGVDSSVSLLLLKKQGYDPIGVSLKYDIWRYECNKCKENVCCSKESFDIAKKICERLGVEHHILDVSKEFKKEVIDYFVSELKSSRTPSPCVFCNPNVKFKSLIEFADENDIKYVATGHYARIRELRIKNKKLWKFELLKAKDKDKDQTYSLSFLTQKELSRIIFPLGNLIKEEVYKIAQKQKGFEIFEKRRQSQDFCFISGDSIPKFLEKEIGIKKGNIVNKRGEKLGEHGGLHFYTIGQRKGIDLPNGPFYVVKKDVDTNTLVISRNQSQFARKKIVLKPFNLISGEIIEKTIDVTAKLRSGATAQKAKLYQKEDHLLLNFSKKQESVTPGQIAVFYRVDICLGAGVIN